MGWAEDQVKTISDAEDKLRQDRQWQLHVNEVIGKEGINLFESLAGHVERYVSQFNEARGEASVKCERTLNSVTVVKEHFPSMSLRLDHAGRVIKAFTREMTHDYYNPHDRRWEMRYTVDTNGILYIDDTSDHERLAQRLLGDVFRKFIPRG